LIAHFITQYLFPNRGVPSSLFVVVGLEEPGAKGSARGRVSQPKWRTRRSPVSRRILSNETSNLITILVAISYLKVGGLRHLGRSWRRKIKKQVKSGTKCLNCTSNAHLALLYFSLSRWVVDKLLKLICNCKGLLCLIHARAYLKIYI